MNDISGSKIAASHSGFHNQTYGYQFLTEQKVSVSVTSRIVTDFGGFDFLFNICRARDDPINPEELPDNFTPIHPPLSPIDVREFREFSSGSYLASSSIVESQTAEQTPGLTFKSSASEGAILTMPEGAFQEELSNISKFRNYIALHATDWYKFVNGPRGREAQNGDICVVVGCDKTTAWGMATFANTSSAKKSKFRLKFRPLRGQQQSQHNTGGFYSWEHSGVAEVRVGPEPGEDEELGETQTGQLRNQCLFMRTLSVTVPDGVWAATFPETVSSINQEGSKPEHRTQSLRLPDPNTAKSHPSSSNSARFVRGTRRSLGASKSVIAQEEDNDNEQGSTSIQGVPWVSLFSAPSSDGGPVNDIRDSDDIVPRKVLRPTDFVDKLYRVVNDPKSGKYMTWTDSGTSFIIWTAQITECLNFLSSTNILVNFSNFMDQLHIYGFHCVNRIHHSTKDQSWEISHPKFTRGRPDLLHEIRTGKRKPHGGPAMKDEIESPRDAPAQLGAIQNEDMRMWDNPSKIINKYLLEQVPYAKIALTHDRDWSYAAKTGFSHLDPSKLIEQVTILNDITVDTESGVVFLEPKYTFLLAAAERAIIGQIEGNHAFSIEQYLFGSNENHSKVLRRLITQLRSDYMSFRHQDTMHVELTPLFLTGHPKRLLSLDDLVDIRQNNIKSLLKHHSMHNVRSELNALPLQHSDRGTWLLRLADALSRRFWHLNQKHDLEEAISYYKEAVSLLPQTHYHFLEAILGLCSSVYQRFQLLGHSDDIRQLLEHLHTEHDLDLESLLTPVKARLQERPRQVVNESSDSKFSNKLTISKGLNAPVPPSNINKEQNEAMMFGMVKDRTLLSSRFEALSQVRPRQVISKRSDSKFSNQTVVDKGLNALVARGNIDKEQNEPAILKKGKMKGFILSRPENQMGGGSKGLEIQPTGAAAESQLDDDNASEDSLWSDFCDDAAEKEDLTTDANIGPDSSPSVYPAATSYHRPGHVHQLCVVCRVKPCRDGYVTCGIKCTKTLWTRGSANPRMCDYCHRRPKLAGYNQCGMTCRDNATTACLLCRCRPRFGRYHLCGTMCKNIAMKWTPLILEARSGHTIYSEVEQMFKLTWKGSGAPCPPIKKIYKIIEDKSFLLLYDRYKKRVGHEVFRYHGTSRKCNLGSHGNTRLCSSSACALCSILRTSFKSNLSNPSGAFGPGIYTSSAANKAYSYSNGGTGAIILTKLVLGIVHDVQGWNQVMSCPPGYNSVVFHRQNGTLNETVVYTDDAIRPVYLITF